MDRIWKFSIMMVILILADQFSKAGIEANYRLGEITPIIDGFFNITYVKNTGAAFGMGAGASDFWRRLLFLFIPVLACGYLVYLIWTTRKQKFILGLAYSLILAGAIGNLIDRFSAGYVVDLFDFYIGTSHFAAFNIADSCITIAAGLLIIDFFMELKASKNKKSDDESSIESKV